MYYSNPAETYIHFNFTNKPVNVISAVVSVDCYSVSQTFNFTASVVTDSWDEYTTTWMNKPNHMQVIGTYLATSSGNYTIDVTNFTSGTDLSICLNASNYSQQGYIQAASREGAYSFEPAPTIAWTYYVPYTNPSAPQSLSATYDSAKQCVDLSWNAPANNGNSSILSYNVYRGDLSGYETFLASSNINYVDYLIASYHTYYYDVTAVNIAGESVNSSEISVTVPMLTSTTQTLNIPGAPIFIILGCAVLGIGMIIQRQKR